MSSKKRIKKLNTDTFLKNKDEIVTEKCYSKYFFVHKVSKSVFNLGINYIRFENSANSFREALSLCENKIVYYTCDDTTFCVLEKNLENWHPIKDFIKKTLYTKVF